MKHLFAAALAFAGAAVALPQAAQAQVPLTPVPISIQLGVGSQLSSSARNATSATSFHAGASLQLGNTTTLLALPGNVSMDVDYNHASGNGGHFDVAGITYASRIELVPQVAQTLTAHITPYVGFGVGLFRDSVSKRVTTTTGSGSTAVTSTRDVAHTSTNLGGKLMVGIKTSTGIFVEASYILSGSSEGVRTDSVDIAVGMKL